MTQGTIRTISRVEFIALMAMLSATVAFSIDAMLPAMPVIAADLTPDLPNRVQLVITSFVFGMGIGTFFTGPLSDTFGRKPVMIAGTIVYMAATLVAWRAQSLEVMLAARVVQGLGASGPRVVAMAVIRDKFKGRDMARIISFVMIVFTLVPAFAPTLGAGIIALAGWRGIFLSFLVFSVISVMWLALRLPETLQDDQRRDLRLRRLMSATREVFANKTTRLSTYVQALSFTMLFATLSTTQQVFDKAYGEGTHFHLWFGVIAIFGGSAGFLNAKLVVRLGMRALIKAMLSVQIAAASIMALSLWLGIDGAISFWIYVVWCITIFFQAGMTIGNLNALAMEPMGHIAGLAASVVSATATIGGAVFAIPIAFTFDGTAFPVAIGVLVCAAVARLITGRIERDQPSQP